MAEGASGGESTPGVDVRVAGAWSGAVRVPSLAACSVAELRQRVASLAGLAPASLRLICAGRTLRDTPALEFCPAPGPGPAPPVGEAGPWASLHAAGVREGAKVLASRCQHALPAPQPQPGDGAGAAAQVPVAAPAERLARIKAAAEALAARTQRGKRPHRDRAGRPGAGPTGAGDAEWDMELELEDQSGQRLTFPSELDRRSLVAGLLLHSKARTFLREEDYAAALELLSGAEEAFSLCDQSLLEAVDNVALVLLDCAWCRFMLRDTASLAQAQGHLGRVRRALQRAHGEDMSRLRCLQGGFQPELAVYLRLHLLEGVVAFHSGDTAEARRRFSSAAMLLGQLQVSDMAMAQLAAMGFSTVEARRGLRMASGDVDRAAEFVLQQREREGKRVEDEKCFRRHRRAQKKYGATPAGEDLDMDAVDELVAFLNLEEAVVAQAVRQAGNSKEAALEVLLDPVALEALQVSVKSNEQSGRKCADSLSVAILVSQGFPQDQVEEALLKASGDEVKAKEMLEASNLPCEAAGGVTSAGEESVMEESNQEAGMDRSDQASQESDESEEESAPRDDEMEYEVAKDVSGDPFEEYDMDVTREAEALQEYQVLLETVGH